MKIWIIRHGETAKNREKRLQGRSDTPLNRQGIAQARKAAAFLAEQDIRFTAVWSSPLSRAVETARLVAGAQAEIRVDDRLLEMDYGPYEGCSLENPPPEILTFFADFVHNPAPEGMESLHHVVERLGRFLEEIASEEPGDVLLSTHAIALKGALEYLTPGAEGFYWSRYVSNCSIWQSEFRHGAYSLPVERFALGYEPGV